MADVNQNRSIIILNVYKLNNPIKRQRLPDWIKKKKQDPVTCCMQETHFRFKDTNRVKVKGWEKTYHANSKNKKIERLLLILDKKTSE